MNSGKSDRVGARQVDMARKPHKAGLLKGSTGSLGLGDLAKLFGERDGAVVHWPILVRPGC
jgi:hypothetical protein